MSYEGDLATHYNGVHKRLLGSPPVSRTFPPLVPLPPDNKNVPEALLLRIESLEEQCRLFKAKLELMECKRHVDLDKIEIIYPQNSHDRHGDVNTIFQVVRKKEQYRSDILLGVERSKELCFVRHIIFYLMATLTNKSLPAIGRFMKKDHTSILHGRDKIAALRLVDPILDENLRWYEAEIARIIAIKSVRKNPLNNVDIGDRSPKAVEST